jgi:hypothetical protein
MVESLMEACYELWKEKMQIITHKSWGQPSPDIAEFGLRVTVWSIAAANPTARSGASPTTRAPS